MISGFPTFRWGVRVRLPNRFQPWMAATLCTKRFRVNLLSEAQLVN